MPKVSPRAIFRRTMSYPTRSVGILAALVSTTAIAAAASYTQKADSESWTDPVGGQGSATAAALTTANFYALRALKVTQYSGKPCVLETGQASLNTGGLNWLDARLNACEATTTREWKQADVGENQFITAIATCSAVDSDGIEGLELWGSTLSPNGIAEPPTTRVKLEFSECKKWQPKRTCPYGMVATGIRAHYDKGTGMVGYSLRCHRIEPREKDTK